ncbi:MAG: excinuclease ABC subunit UvrB [Bacteroidales bacterium]|nr:excinuclease ABC subunit UvrB [Bacteroidales bacterium]
MKEFKLHTDFTPSGDQPEAIRLLSEGVKRGDNAQVLIGVTGSGKTFTIANVIQQTGMPTLVLSHNKTLAAQLYSEFKHFFPENAVEYYVSYYDYYQPEAYIPSSNTYIEKDLSINDEIDKLRLSALSALLSGRRDLIIVSSVSCIYGTGNPADYHDNIIILSRGQQIEQRDIMLRLVSILYSRNEVDFGRGKFRVKGDTLDVFVAYDNYAYRIINFDNEIERLQKIDPESGAVVEELDDLRIYPANMFVPSSHRTQQAIKDIQLDLGRQIDFFRNTGRPLEAKRIEDRVTYDVEMIKELGYCTGIENYSRYFDGRAAGTRPYCLLDYFPNDFLMVIDESHVTVSQIKAMYGGDRSRKTNLVEYGFRLPAALDNRPLTFDEFETLTPQTIYVSATPADYELEKAGGVVVEQIVRPTGLLDPPIEVRPVKSQVDDLLEEIKRVTEGENGERVLVTTLTKKMAEELSVYMARLGIRCRYIHSDVDTLERVEILQDLRAGRIDVLIGVNLLREGLDLPEVSLVAILDADKEGFLRSGRALTQTAGRAARNINSKVIFYADKITEAMRATIDETKRRREKQMAYNKQHGITPKQIIKQLDNALRREATGDTAADMAAAGTTRAASRRGKATGAENITASELARTIAMRAASGSGGIYADQYAEYSEVADPVMQYNAAEKNPARIQQRINELEDLMNEAARDLRFLDADRYLQAIERLKKQKQVQ